MVVVVVEVLAADPPRIMVEAMQCVAAMGQRVGAIGDEREARGKEVEDSKSMGSQRLREF